MNRMTLWPATCLVAVVIVGCGTVVASSSAGGAHPAVSAVHASAVSAQQSQAASALNASVSARTACRHPANGVLTLASNGKTYCVKVGEKFSVYLRGTVASRWLVPLASSDVIKPVPNGALSLIAGLTGESFAGVRPGQVLITSLRPPCAGPITQKNEFEPSDVLPRVYPLRVCAPKRRFSVTVIVLG